MHKAFNSKRMLVYNHNHGIPLKTVTYSNGLQTPESSYGYNAIVLLTSNIVIPYTSTKTLVSSMQCETYGRIFQETDPLGLVTTFVFNPSTGVLAYTEDHKAQATTFTYDNLLRRTGTLYPDGIKDSVEFVWSATSGLYGVTSKLTGSPSQTSYYDAFGRHVRTDAVRYNGTVLHTDTDYDAFGRAYRESFPFTGSTATYWNTTTFDDYDRPTGIAYASGKSAAYSYSGKNVTATADGITSTYYYDAQGNLTSVTDPAGTITHNLRPDGQPSSIVAPGNITTGFGYDAYGRQESIDDPSAGTRSFQYDADGNLWKETDADNRVKTMLYDTYGRLTKKVLPEITTYYRYDGDGFLAADSSDNGALRTFKYDTYGRLYKDRDNTPDSKWLEKTYAYSAGNVSAILFESNLGVIGTESYYYANGHLNEIKLGATSVWQLTGENSLGQITSVATGPVSRTYNYNVYGISEGRSASTSTASTFQNHTYTFDALKGNLSNRKDNTRNLQENFTYDNLNRLKTFAGFNMEYDVKGNILEKSDAGNMFYYNTPNKPYAISGVDAGTSMAIPQRNQAVTYTSFERPASITENNYQALFTYNGSGSRKKMEIKNNGNMQYNRYYLGGRYETDLGTSINSQRLYIGGNAFNNLSGNESLQDNIGNGFGHLQNIGGHVDDVGSYKGRTIIRLNENHIGSNQTDAISFGHYIFGHNIAFNPSDDTFGQTGIDLFSHEYGHTYQSRTSGPLYLFKYGIPSAARKRMSENDANRRSAYHDLYLASWRDQDTNKIKWWELVFGTVLWPFMWGWNF